MARNRLVSVCTANGTSVTLTTTGTCTVRAEQAGDPNYSAASPVDQSFNVTTAVLDQAITFAALPKRALAQSPFTVNATASSGLPVTFTTTTPAVCTASGPNGATITLATTGKCTVRAGQPGNATYNAAPSVNISFNVVAKLNQRIKFTALPKRALAQSPIAVSAIATSGLPVTFITTTPAVCISSGLDGATITLVAPGKCTVIANQAGDPSYNPAPSVSRSFTVVTKFNQTITFAALVDRTLAESPFTVSATASSGLAVTFTTTTPAVCTASGLDGATITLLAAGTCKITASQAGDSIYNSKTVNRTFTVT